MSPVPFWSIGRVSSKTPRVNQPCCVLRLTWWYVMPGKTLEQSTHETGQPQRRMWFSTCAFLSVSLQPSHEKKTMVDVGGLAGWVVGSSRARSGSWWRERYFELEAGLLWCVVDIGAA